MERLIALFKLILPLLDKLPIAAIQKLFTTLPAFIKVASPPPVKGGVLVYLQKIGIVQPLSDVVEPVWEAVLDIVSAPLSLVEAEELAGCCDDDCRCKALVENALIVAAQETGVKLNMDLLVMLVELLLPLVQAWLKRLFPDPVAPVDPAR